MIDDRPTTDADIVAGVHAWHPSNREKFTTARIAAEIAALRERGYVPTGTLPHTQPRPDTAD